MKPSTKLFGERTIAAEKVVKYLLNLDHPEGWSKAKFFIERGFEAGNPDILTDALHEHADLNDISIVKSDIYGTKSIVRCSIATPDGRNPCIQVVWIREHDCEQQRLATAYPSDEEPILG